MKKTNSKPKQLTAVDFNAPSLKRIDIPDLNGFVYIEKLSVQQSLLFTANKNKEGSKSTDMEKTQIMVMQSVTDDKGVKVFTDVDQVIKSNLCEFKLLTNEILDFNGLSDTSVEKITKN